MANARNSNTWHIDSTGDLTPLVPVTVYYVVLAASSANAHLVLSDAGASTKKLDVRVATSHESKVFDFSANPIHFPNGIEVTTITNGVATLVL